MQDYKAMIESNHKFRDTFIIIFYALDILVLNYPNALNVNVEKLL